MKLLKRLLVIAFVMLLVVVFAYNIIDTLRQYEDIHATYSDNSNNRKEYSYG